MNNNTIIIVCIHAKSCSKFHCVHGEFICLTTKHYWMIKHVVSTILCMHVVPVQVIPLPPTISRNSGSSLTLTCNATGSPLPTVSWLKDGSTLQTTQETTVTIITVNNNTIHSVLSITPLADEHEGVYTCVASNVLPNGTLNHTSSFTLDVIGSKSLKFLYV